MGVVEQGAYADFTFPAWGTMEPPRELEDAIFYAADDELPVSRIHRWTPMAGQMHQVTAAIAIVDSVRGGV